MPLADALRAHGPFDVPHCHYGPVGVIAHQARALLGWETPIAVTFHGYDLSRGTAIDDRAYAALFETAALLLPVSETWRDALIERGAPAERTVTHRMGVDLERFRPPVRGAQPPLRLVSVCRLVEKKGLADALHAIAVLRDRGQDVRYRIVGDGPLESQLIDAVGRLELQDHVQLDGWQPPEVVRARLQDADVLLSPSVTAADGDQEGIPVSMMEAMAMGLPVVSTWHSGVPELAEDGVNGFLVQEQSPAALADRLATLAADEQRRTAMGRSAAERVSALHDQDQLDDQLVDHVHSLTGDRIR